MITVNEYFEVQTLLFEEAALIDDWRLEEWLNLYTDSATYQVPPTDVSDEDVSPQTHLYYIADNRRRMEERVIRLNKKTCHSEYPRSRVRHLVSNIRVLENNDQTMIVEASFVIFRSKDGTTDEYMGKYNYELSKTHESLKIHSKKCYLDLDGLRPQARISIIL